jgi:WD40 repeat protein
MTTLLTSSFLDKARPSAARRLLIRLQAAGVALLIAGGLLADAPAREGPAEKPATPGSVRVEIKHKGGVRCLAWSADGRLIASGTGDGAVRINVAATGKEVQNLAVGHTVVGVAFSPDSKTLAVSCEEETASSWDVATGQRQAGRAFVNYKGEQLAFTADGKMVIGVAPGQSFRWMLPNGFSGSRSGKVAPDAYAAVAPDGAVCAWGEKGSVHIREWEPKSRITTLEVGDARCIALGPKGTVMAVGGDDKGVHLWDWAAKNKTATLEGMERPPVKLSFAADGAALAALADDGQSIHVWDLTDKRTRRRLHHHEGAVQVMALSPDGKLLATTGTDGVVFVRSVAARELTRQGSPLKLSPKELADLWQRLADADGNKADDAWRKLGAAGDGAVPFLREQMRALAVPPVDRKRLDRWLADLDSDSFEARERASKALAEMGELALGPVQRLLKDPPSLEVKMRARLILEKITEPVRTPDRRRVLESIELLEQLRTAAALDLLKELERDALVPQIRTEARQALERAARATAEKK